MTTIHQAKSIKTGVDSISNQKLVKEDVTESTSSTTEKSAGSKTTETSRLHPFVHWAQSQTHISLRIDLLQAENLNANIRDDGLSLVFSAQGRGAHGLRDYYFELEFYSEVEKKFEYHTIERYVLVLIKKASTQVNWPRLTKHTTKLAWLRVDFDRYASESSDECDQDNTGDDNEIRRLNLLKEELEETKSIPHNKKSSSNSWASNLNSKTISSISNLDIFNPFNRRNRKTKNSSSMKYDYRKETVATDNGKNTAKHAMDFKKTYLFIYNLMMFIMFLKVYIVLVIKGLNGTVDDDIVQGTAFIVKMLTYTQLLETLHPVLGLVPGGPLMPFTQVIGRILVNYYLSEPSIRRDSAPFAQYLFVVWSSIEIFRYSFYALRVFKVNVKALTWCRYTLFIPLYPMGGFCETMVILSSIKYYEKTGAGLSLPNSANISFNLPVMFRVYIVGLWFTIYYLMRYMWSQRCKQLKEKVV